MLEESFLTLQRHSETGQMAGNTISRQNVQIAVRGQGQKTCLNHRKKTLDWFCETCHDVICAKCISSLHKKHDIVLLRENTPNNKRKIETFINKTQQREQVKLQQEINSTQDSLKKHLDHFKTVAEEVKKQGEQIKTDIDDLIAKTLSQLKNLEDEHTQLLSSYQTELERKLTALKDQLEQCKETLQTGTDIQVFDVTSRLHTGITLPSKPVLGTAKFSKNKHLTETLTSAFGKITLTSPGQPDDHVFADDANSVGSLDPQRSSNQITFESNDSAQHATPLPKNLSEWDSPCDIGFICLASNGSAWTNFFDGTTLTLLTNEGRLKQQIKDSIAVTNICISPSSQNVWACSEEDNSVMELKPGTWLTSQTLVRKFNTKDKPRCLCVTKDNHILVGMEHGIVKYTPRGNQSLTISSHSKKTPVFSPRIITECPVTENVAVLDRDRLYDGGENEPAIVLMDKHLQELYRYGTQQHIGWTGSQSFDPCSITYDRRGQLVVADYSNDSLHLLSGDGEYLRLLCTDIDIHRPLAVCVERQGILWVAFGDVFKTDKVKRFQYTSD